MIEREFIKNKINELYIKNKIESRISSRAGIGGIYFEKTPLGEKVIIEAVKPGLIIGRGGETIKDLTKILKNTFKLENPQIEVREIQEPNLNAKVIARNILFKLENFGIRRFKPISYNSLSNVMKAGAMGCEIKISGKVPSQRSRVWRFYNGYMKKCGHVAQDLVDSATMVANTKSGAVGIKVKIMLPNTPLPDKVKFKTIHVEEVDEKGNLISKEEISAKEAENQAEKSAKSAKSAKSKEVEKEKSKPAKISETKKEEKKSEEKTKKSKPKSKKEEKN